MSDLPQKKAGEMTSEELAARVFPKEVHEALKEAAQEPAKPEKKSSQGTD